MAPEDQNGPSRSPSASNCPLSITSQSPLPTQQQGVVDTNSSNSKDVVSVTSTTLFSSSYSSFCPDNSTSPSEISKISYESAVANPSPTWLTRLNPFYWLPSWKPTSMNQLFQAESQMLRLVKSNLDRFFIKICHDKYRIWSMVATNKDTAKATSADLENVPLVLVHGMGGGNGIWAMNIDDLARDRKVYSFDLLGFGMSSRPKFSQNPALVESEFVDSVESWRQALQLKPPFILLGHSLGGYVAASYAIKHPSHVKHLILVDPWGVPEMPNEHELGRDWPVWVKALRVVLQPFNPLAAVRGAGPWGPALVKRFRPDFQRRYSDFFSAEDDTVFDYIYHLNARPPSGEAAFKTLAAPYGFAKDPVIKKIDKLDVEVPITFIYGAKSWITSESGREIKKLRPNSYVDVHEIAGAGHHVYADRPHQFNNVVNAVASFVDAHLDANLNPSDCCVKPSEEPENVGPAGDAGLSTKESVPKFPLKDPQNKERPDQPSDK